MFESLIPFLEPETLTLIGTGLGTLLAAGVLAVRGFRHGRSTSPTEGELQSAGFVCRVEELALPTMLKFAERIDNLDEKLSHRIDAVDARDDLVAAELRQMRDMLVVLQERTRKS